MQEQYGNKLDEINNTHSLSTIEIQSNGNIRRQVIRIYRRWKESLNEDCHVVGLDKPWTGNHSELYVQQYEEKGVEELENGGFTILRETSHNWAGSR